jgi:hypothetical protein
VVDDLKSRGYVPERHRVELELRACDFRGGPKFAWFDIASRAGLTRGEFVQVFDAMRNDESERALAEEFPPWYRLWKGKVDELRDDFPGQPFDIACVIVRGVLRDDEPQIPDIVGQLKAMDLTLLGTAELICSERTTQRHRGEMRVAIQAMFPRGPKLRGSGRVAAPVAPGG